MKLYQPKIFENTLERIEKKLGLENQPRVIVFHEKHGRRHAHCVWSRIKADEMKAIDQPYFKNKLQVISKQLYLDHGWDLPKGFIDKRQKNPLNYTRAEWQQAERTGQNPKAIKATLQECWATSDNKNSFSSALNERGYYLAKGDRRGFVVIDIHGEVYSLTRQINRKKKEIENRIGKADALPSIDKVRDKISGKISKLFKNFLTEQSKDHQKALKPLLKTKQAMTGQHRIDRAAQKSWQENRWQKEELKRVSRIRKGFKGIWDKLNGRYWKTRKRNEQETAQAHIRDQSERDHLIKKQLIQRQNLQIRLNQMQAKHEKDRQNLIRDLSQMSNMKETKGMDRISPEPSPTKSHEPKSHNGHENPDNGFEPEI